MDNDKQTTTTEVSKEKRKVVELPKISREVKGQLYNELRDALFAPSSKNSKKSWAQNYIGIMLEEAKKNPSGAIGQWVAKQFMTDDIISKLDEQTDKYMQKDRDFLEYRLLKQLYGKQRDVFLDDMISKKIVIGSRRIGKSTLASRLLVKDAIRPNRNAFYIGLKFETAINQAYDETLRMAQSIGLTVAKDSKVDGHITFTNGSTITFKGNYNIRDQENNFQGYKISLCILDEVQSQRNVAHLLDDLIRPAMTDYEDAKIVLLGTPPRIKGTYAEKVWKEFTGWKHYSWNMGENPYILKNKTVEQVVKEICEEKGITKDAPFIRREYYGEWYYDVEAQVFKDYKVYEGEIPESFIPTDIAIGGDYGFSDFNAFVALAYNRYSKEGWVIAETKFNRSSVSEIVDRARNIFELSKKFAIERDNSFNLGNINFYCDTNEQSITYELSTTYKLPARNCYKYDKKMAISQLAEALRTKIAVPKDGILTDEFDQTIYKRDEQDNITSEIDDDLFHPDAADALLYAFRQYIFDCGEDDDSVIEKTENSRNATLPTWMSEE